MKEFPPFRLDSTNQCVWRAGAAGADERLDLAPKTFALLRYFVDHPGRLITHDELLGALWQDVHVQPEVLKSHILAVRNILGDKARTPIFIESLRGRGYRFIAAVRGGAQADESALAPLPRGIFVGRTKPLAELAAIRTLAIGGSPQIVFVAGEPGIGKTTLTDQFVNESAGIKGISVSYGRCVDGNGGSEPYYPVLEALSRLCKGPFGESVVRALISLAPTWAVQLPGQVPAETRIKLQRQIVGAARDRMLREICELLESLAAERPLVLVLEDMHWADYSTVDLLAAIAYRRSAAKFMIIATYRPDDSERHPVQNLNHELHARRFCAEINLGPLAEEAVAEFLAGGATLDAGSKEFAHIIRGQSGGNPLFMHATLDHLVERDLVSRSGRGWQLRVPAAQIGFQVPHTLSQIIEVRIQRLDEDQQRLLEAASVAGMEFSAATTAFAADLDLEVFEDICEKLARRDRFIHRGELQMLADGTVMRKYGFNHAMYWRVFYNRQGPTRLMNSHRRVAQRVEALYTADQCNEISVDLARHFAIAQDWPRALHYLRKSLQTAKLRFAHRAALAILDQASEVITNLPPSARAAAEIDVLERRAAIYTVEHDPRAEETYLQLAEKAAAQGQTDLQARSLLGLAQATSWRDPEQCLRVLQEAWQLTTRQTNFQLQAFTQICLHVRRIWTFGWNAQDASECDQAVQLLKSGNDPVVTAEGLIEYTMICLVSTRYREGADIFLENYHYLLNHSESRTEFNLTRAIWMRHVSVPWCLLYLGDFGAALEESDAGIAALTSNGNHTGANVLRIYKALALVHLNDFAGVLELCECLIRPANCEIQQVGDGIGDAVPGEHRLALVLCGLAQAGLGNVGSAFEYFAEAERRMDSQPVMFDWYWRLPLEWGWANALIAGGDSRGGKLRAQRFIRLAESTEERTWQGLAWETNARAALAQGDAVEARNHIAKALSATEGFETPLADWRVLQTAAAAAKALGKGEEATMHAHLSTQKREEIAGSLPKFHRLRVIFEDST